MSITPGPGVVSVGVKLSRSDGSISCIIPYRQVLKHGSFEAACASHGYPPEVTEVDFTEADLVLCPSCGLGFMAFPPYTCPCEEMNDG